MKSAYLIVNADDFGYFDCVSHGIIAAARHGVVTATGIFANSNDLERQVEELSLLPELDVGVHLNLTVGRPCSIEMQAQLERYNGFFPGKFKIASAVLRHDIKVATIKEEWRSQIMRCLALGLRIWFLNSHEHLHMMPPLYRIVCELAHEFDIPYVRYANAEWSGHFTPGGAVRNVLLSVLGIFIRKNRGSLIPMLGLMESGKLSLQYLQDRLATFSKGGIYELMCHPGMANSDEPIDPQLRAYHDWDFERNLLCGCEFRQLLQQHDIQLIGYRHLEINENRVGIEGGMS